MAFSWGGCCEGPALQCKGSGFWPEEAGLGSSQAVLPRRLPGLPGRMHTLGGWGGAVPTEGLPAAVLREKDRGTGRSTEVCHSS